MELLYKSAITLLFSIMALILTASWPVSSSALNDQSEDVVKSGFYTIGGKIYYVGLDVLVSWEDALQMCASLNMRLLSLETEAKVQQISDFVVTLPTETFPYYHFWTSGVRVNNKTLVWTNIGEQVSYINWFNGSHYDGQDCLILHAEIYAIDDYYCDNRRKYICEFPCNLQW